MFFINLMGIDCLKSLTPHGLKIIRITTPEQKTQKFYGIRKYSATSYNISLLFKRGAGC